jgi:hypothetical protein
VIEWPVYRRGIDGNVFDWIIQASEVCRQLRAQERFNAAKKAAEKSESLDKPKMGNS